MTDDGVPRRLLVRRVARLGIIPSRAAGLLVAVARRRSAGGRAQR
ncbi:hypothetical protein AB0B94_06095 [Micromonospora sp. NPDC048986]